jgi:8-oxo-dGTP pyrophosphatase MutT (NUDIX family)
MQISKMAQRLAAKHASEDEGNLRVETLHENEWLSLKKMVYPEANINGYVYSHETRCKGNVVSVLPIRLNPKAPRGLEILVRKEVTPCWHPTKPMISSITGGCEDGSTPAGDTCRELEEEAGYKVTPDMLISLGTIFGTKSTDTIYHLYTVDLTGIPQEGEGAGDGSELEALATCEWSSGPMGAQDPFVYAIWTRMFYDQKVQEVLGS